MPEGRDQPIAIVGPDPNEVMVESDSDSKLVEFLSIDRTGGVLDLLSNAVIKRDKTHGTPRLGKVQGRGNGFMPTGAVVDDEIACPWRRAGQHVPYAETMLCPIEPLHVRQATSGNDHCIGRFSQNLIGFGVSVAPNLDTQPLQLGHPPVDNADEVPAPFSPRGQEKLPAWTGAGFEQDDLVPALCSSACGFKAPGTAADHNNLPARFRRGLYDLRKQRFPAGRRIVDAVDLLLHAIGSPDTGSDPLRLSAHQLVDDLWIGHMSTESWPPYPAILPQSRSVRSKYRRSDKREKRAD